MIEKCYIDGCLEPVCMFMAEDDGYITCLVHAHSELSGIISEEAITRAAYHYMYLSQELKEEIRDLKSQLWMWPQ